MIDAVLLDLSGVLYTDTGPVPGAVEAIDRLEALNELYPNVSSVEIITDLISSALDEMETSLPYIKGQRVIAEDDQGDPIYEDIGSSSTFQNSSRKHEEILHAEIKETRSKS